MTVHAPDRAKRGLNDKIDSRILHVLQRDGRISNLKLAEQVNLSPSAVLERVKRLKREGYILGYQARLNREKLGMEVVAFVEVQLERMSSELMARFEAAVRERPSVLECHLIAGTFDYLLKVLVPDLHACRELVDSEISRLPGVREVELYTPLDWPSALPWRRARHFQRNKVVFDDAAALTAALHSPIRHEMRADFHRFPRFHGRVVHHPMATRVIVP